MEYSAGLMSHMFWLAETRITAEKMCDGLSQDAIRELAVSENIYQMKNPTRAGRNFSAIYNRLCNMPFTLVEMISKGDAAIAKVLVLISMMKTDKLFFEFIYEIYRGKIILGEKNIASRDIILFFNQKETQSEVISSWSDTTKKKLKQVYIRSLFEAGLLSDTKECKIIPAYVDYRVRDVLESNSMTMYFYAITGEK